MIESSLMKMNTLFYFIISIFLLQGCSQKETVVKQKVVDETPIKIQNLDALNEKVNSFINDKYIQEIGEHLSLGINYDTEYINTQSKTVVFIKYKNSIYFCGSVGCSAEMLEYEEDSFKHIESFTPVKSSIYLLHKLSDYGFEKIIIPVYYINEKEEKALYYNIYEPFSPSDNQSLYPQDFGYEEIKTLLNDRKKSIKLFDKVEN